VATATNAPSDSATAINGRFRDSRTFMRMDLLQR
jgi:hypothetical protein